MTLLDSICCTCAISSLRTAGFCRRYGWRSGGSWVSIACSSSGVFPRSSSPRLKTSLNLRNSSFSCCCWSGERRSGSGGWHSFRGCEEVVEALAGVSASFRARNEAGEALVGDCAQQSRAPDHWRALECRSKRPGEHRSGKRGRPWWAMDCGNGHGVLSREGYLLFAAAERS